MSVELVRAANVERLQERLSVSWPRIIAARAEAHKTLQSLKTLLSVFESEDTSVVAYGSLARLEFTARSDLDWTLLIDGSAMPEHRDVARSIHEELRKGDYKSPGREGTFGAMAFSHELIHLIGGQDDTNRNTTQRILLLLESAPIGQRTAYDRVKRGILSRYVEEDRGLWYSQYPKKIPRFLLNDIVRYWRTMAVDFAYKMRERAQEGWALRSLKLRMSRKLLFAAGMLLCFNCQLRLSKEERKKLSSDPPTTDVLVSLLQSWSEAPPLDLLAGAFLQDQSKSESAKTLFGAYDQFLGMMDDQDVRQHLGNLSVDRLSSDEHFQKARELGHVFQDGLTALFLDEGSELGLLTRLYGVF